MRPRPITRENASYLGARGRESYARKREAKKIALWRCIVQGQPLKVAAYTVGISYGTARRYRKEA